MVYDSWDLATLRDAAEFNRANPDPEHAGAEQWVEEKLAAAEAQLVRKVAVPVADEAPGSLPRGTGASNYGGQATTGASEAQERFIRSLCEERGLDADAVLASVKDRRAASKKIDELKAMPRQEQVRPATERQAEYLQDLLAERVHSFDLGDPRVAAEFATFKGASLAIELLQQAPRLKAPVHGIRPGRYAYQLDGANDQFYRVAQDGRIYVQAGPAEHPYRAKLNEALLAIKADPKTHAALYGQLIGRCGRCSLPLTDDTSRSIGLGPICASKSDW